MSPSAEKDFLHRPKSNGGLGVFSTAAWTWVPPCGLTTSPPGLAEVGPPGLEAPASVAGGGDGFRPTFPPGSARVRLDLYVRFCHVLPPVRSVQVCGIERESTAGAGGPGAPLLGYHVAPVPTGATVEDRNSTRAFFWIGRRVGSWRLWCIFKQCTWAWGSRFFARPRASSGGAWRAACVR